MRTFHMATAVPPDEQHRIADNNNVVVCTLPREEARLARFILASLNTFGRVVKRYDRNDWLRERNTYRGNNDKAAAS